MTAVELEMTLSVEPPDEMLMHAIDVALEKHQVKYKLRAKQVECIQHVVNGKDVMAILPTG